MSIQGEGFTTYNNSEACSCMEMNYKMCLDNYVGDFTLPLASRSRVCVLPTFHAAS